MASRSFASEWPFSERPLSVYSLQANTFKFVGSLKPPAEQGGSQVRWGPGEDRPACPRPRPILLTSPQVAVGQCPGHSSQLQSFATAH